MAKAIINKAIAQNIDQGRGLTAKGGVKMLKWWSQLFMMQLLLLGSVTFPLLSQFDMRSHSHRR